MRIVRENKIEFDWALKQLEASGLIAQGGEDGFALTEGGRSHVRTFIDRLGIQNRILLRLWFYTQFLEYIEEVPDL